jgi:Glycosyltransferase family 17
MKVYDCFTFYNELDLLDIRLAELDSVVDYFVLVEANQTFTNRPKPFVFEENKQRYQKYLDKIIHVRVDDMPGSANAWDNERHQRNAILRGIESADPTDIIIVSDCDEVLRASAIGLIKSSEQSIFALRMPLFNFKFNYMRTTPGEYEPWAMAARKAVFNEITPDTLRSIRFNFSGASYQLINDGCQIVEHAGWHFGYLGNKDYLIDKVQSFSHQEANTPEFIAQIDPEASIAKRTSWLQTSTEQYKIVAIDNYFPATIKNYPDFILDDADTSAYNLLPQYPYQ